MFSKDGFYELRLFTENSELKKMYQEKIEEQEEVEEGSEDYESASDDAVSYQLTDWLQPYRFETPQAAFLGHHIIITGRKYWL